jgi:hypothetical protein
MSARLREFMAALEAFEYAGFRLLGAACASEQYLTAGGDAGTSPDF